MFSQTLGTALGNWTANSAGLGYEGGAILFSALLLLAVAKVYTQRLSKTETYQQARIHPFLTGKISLPLEAKVISNLSVYCFITRFNYELAFWHGKWEHYYWRICFMGNQIVGSQYDSRQR